MAGPFLGSILFEVDIGANMLMRFRILKLLAACCYSLAATSCRFLLWDLLLFWSALPPSLSFLPCLVRIKHPPSEKSAILCRINCICFSETSCSRKFRELLHVSSGHQTRHVFVWNAPLQQRLRLRNHRRHTRAVSSKGMTYFINMFPSAF